MFEQLMNKDLGKTTSIPLVTTSTTKDGTSSSSPKDLPSAILMESVDTNSGCFSRFNRTFRLECSRFDGGDFLGWLMKLEQFFEGEKIEEKAKIRVAMMQLEGKVLQWHQYYAKANGGLATPEWPTYIDEMRKRFGDTEFSDPMSDIVVLKQQGSVEEYYEAFLTLLNSLQLPPAYALSIFISNLRPEISNIVRLFFPKSLSHAFTLAK